MFLRPPVEIPGTSIRPPDRPDSKRCPHCGRRFFKEIIKKVGKKVVMCCPYCGGLLSES